MTINDLVMTLKGGIHLHVRAFLQRLIYIWAVCRELLKWLSSWLKLTWKKPKMVARKLP